MIKYQLICKKCELSFNSWFSSSEEFEKLKKKKYLNCNNCNSLDIEKSLMKPNVLHNKTELNDLNLKVKKSKIKKTLREYQKFIKNNFEYVGKNFAYEARSIHYNDKKRDKGIYGTASSDEINDLKEEGINTEVIPWIEDKNN